MNDEHVNDRANAAGAVGQYLKGLLVSSWVPKVRTMAYEHQISAVFEPQFDNVVPTPLMRAAAAFLVPDFPVQVPLSSGGLSLLLQAVLPEPTIYSHSVDWLTSIASSVRSFPLKSNPMAQNKVNLFLSEVMADLNERSSTNARSASAALWPVRGKLFNDQATAAVLYGYGLSQAGIVDAFHTAVSLVKDPSLAKGLTLFIKAVGANGNSLGSMLCEANTLQGRDVGLVDLYEEARYRTTNECHDKIASFPENELRAAIKLILREELADDSGNTALRFGTLEEHWATRWEWAVNGAHSSRVSREYKSLPRPSGMLREHRRAWLERTRDDPRPSWDGTTYVSVSGKLEAGKTRSIFACDTVNYLAFEHLMKPVEKRWRGTKVVLDPGKGGHAGMVFNTIKAREGAGVSMMLDYDDFNSQHSNRAMQILIEETAAATQYPPDLTAKLVASFDRTNIYVKGDRVGLSRGTLMSGHRCTTFINTCLNRAYLMIVLGELLTLNPALHVGDDVYLGVTTYQQAGECARRIASSPLRMNPAKQSVGHITQEFLRNATSGRNTRAYFPRAVASTTCGNWVNDLALSPSEALTSMLAAARALANRSVSDDTPQLLFRSIVRMTRLAKEDQKKLRRLLDGSLALDNGPQFKQGAYYHSVRLLVESVPSDDHGYTPLPQLAATQYLTEAAGDLEREVLCRGGVSVLSAMEVASYKKSWPARYQHFESVRFASTNVSTAIGSVSIVSLLKERVPVGVLSRYPLIRLARERLGEDLIRWAVEQAGGNPDALDLDLEAWGEHRHGCIIASPLSYADAAHYGKLTNSSVLTSPQNMYI